MSPQGHQKLGALLAGPVTLRFTLVLSGEEMGDFPDSSVGKESAHNAGDPSSIPGLHPREHNWDRTPTHSHLNLDSLSQGLPRPGCAPGAFPAAVATTESTTGKPSPTTARSRTLPRATRVHPAPAALPARFQLQWLLGPKGRPERS